MSDHLPLPPQGPTGNGPAPEQAGANLPWAEPVTVQTTAKGPLSENDSEGGLRAPPGLSRLGKVWWWFHFLILVKLARLRFIAVVAAMGAVIVYWDTLTNYYERWTRVSDGHEHAGSDTEFFCPMHPQIVRDTNKEKCPICHMPLSKRKKGTGKPEPLPPGTVSRVQLTPYRVVLAGVQTSEVEYVRLTKELVTAGFVEFDETKQKHIAARQKGRIVTLYANVTGASVHPGDKLALLDVRYSTELMATVKDLLRARRNRNRRDEEMARTRLRLWDLSDDQIREILRTGKVNTRLTIRSPIKGHIIEKYQVEGKYVDEGTPLYDVADLYTVWVEAQVYEDNVGLLRVGQKVRVTTEAYPNRPFPGKVAFIHPHLDQKTRTLRVRITVKNPRHGLRPGMYATVTIKVQPAQLRLIPATLASGLKAQRRSQLRRGRVLAVPESAVIDTGRLKVVYREASPGVYEGVKVRLGPRMVGPGGAAYYPVVRGLLAGEKVVTEGAFLIDAETRLNPAAGSIYFGGTGSKGGTAAVTVRPSTPEAEDARAQKAQAGLKKLPPRDRRLAAAQRSCPIEQNNLLGEMGKPFKIILKGRPVFLCCSSCEDRARENPKATLATVDRRKNKGKAKRARPPAKKAASAANAQKEAKIKANLQKLNPEDRKLARAQRFCPIQDDNRLGSMGKPFKVLVKGQPVFLCCQGCEDDALEHPGQTLAKVKELKAKAKKAKR
jgi:Cu(I)/Ag(I) efflux system membrane fusion protein